jgi:hypothetical protein
MSLLWDFFIFFFFASPANINNIAFISIVYGFFLLQLLISTREMCIIIYLWIFFFIYCYRV